MKITVTNLFFAVVVAVAVIGAATLINNPLQSLTAHTLSVSGGAVQANALVGK